MRSFWTEQRKLVEALENLQASTEEDDSHTQDTSLWRNVMQRNKPAMKAFVELELRNSFQALSVEEYSGRPPLEGGLTPTVPGTMVEDAEVPAP